MAVLGRVWAVFWGGVREVILLVANLAVMGLQSGCSLVTVIESCMALGAAGFGGVIGAGGFTGFVVKFRCATLPILGHFRSEEFAQSF